MYQAGQRKEGKAKSKFCISGKQKDKSQVVLCCRGYYLVQFPFHWGYCLQRVSWMASCDFHPLISRPGALFSQGSTGLETSVWSIKCSRQDGMLFEKVLLSQSPFFLSEANCVMSYPMERTARPTTKSCQQPQAWVEGLVLPKIILQMRLLTLTATSWETCAWSTSTS